MIQIPNWNKVLIAVVCALGLIYAAPNFFKEDFFEGVPSWLPGKQINLGLDLRGGVHLLMNVEIEKVVGKRLDSMRDATRQSMRPLRRRFACRFLCGMRRGTTPGAPRASSNGYAGEGLASQSSS